MGEKEGGGGINDVQWGRNTYYIIKKLTERKGEEKEICLGCNI